MESIAALLHSSNCVLWPRIPIVGVWRLRLIKGKILPVQTRLDRKVLLCVLSPGATIQTAATVRLSSACPELEKEKLYKALVT